MVVVVVVASALAATYLIGQGGWINNNNSTVVGTTSKANGVSDSGPHSIGYVGCSNTADAVTGYYQVPNGGLFCQPYPTGRWSINRRFSGMHSYRAHLVHQAQR